MHDYATNKILLTIIEKNPKQIENLQCPHTAQKISKYYQHLKMYRK